MQILWAFRYNPSRSGSSEPTPLGVVSRLRRLKSKRPRLRVCHHAQRVTRCARIYHHRLTATIRIKILDAKNKIQYGIPIGDIKYGNFDLLRREKKLSHNG
ncbi:MAG: hypothetical protein LBK44_06680 [Spirochaetales bacterium]|nr:hypothetical protein [Spirochaetales bacterium]